ncbi:MAG: SPFH domain-containing protein, partial [Pseudolabrys sp.]
GQTFVNNGGFKGLQEQVMLAGRYFLNPLFATVEIRNMTEVPIAYAGVVIAYVGEPGVDVTGDSFKHGNLVSRGQKGVWVEPLDPGKYPINPYTHKVENVPTANVVLNWATGKSEAHKLDANLSTITVRSSDGFKFNLDVSQIIHIPRTDAPRVIARMGSMLNLVTQVLEPTIGNYFRNAAQGSDVIDFLRKRAERQADAKARISAALEEYNVGAVDTLIGDITPPEELMKPLTDRKIAEQEKVTYETQRLAEQTRKELQQARALADTQAKVVDAERRVQIADFDAQSTVKQAEGAARSRIINAEGDAKAKTTNADADAKVLQMVGAAEAGKTKMVGTAEADVIKLKIESMQSGNYAGIEIAKALASSGTKLVPDIVATGGGGNSGLTGNG